jgi:hypothetical protein
MFSADPRRLVALTAAPVAAIAVLSAGATAAHAQGGLGMSPQQKQAQGAQLKKELGFNDTQVSKFQAKQDVLFKGVATKAQAMQKKYGNNPTPEQRQTMGKEMRPVAVQFMKDMESALLSVATPAQQTKIKAKMAEAKKRMQQQGAGGAGRPAPGR